MKWEGSILSISVLQLILLIFSSKCTQLFWQNILGLLLEKKKKKNLSHFPPNQVSHPKPLNSDAARVSPQVSWLKDTTKPN